MQVALVGVALYSSVFAAEVQMTTQGTSSYRLKVATWSEIPFRSVVRQQYDFSCGSAAVATLLTYHYRRAMPEREIFAAMWAAGNQPIIRQSGFSMLDIKRYLDGLGYGARGFRLSFDQLRKMDRPGLVILDLKGYKHFVVVKGIEGDRLLIGDPMIGLTRYTSADFRSHWNGIFLTIVDPPQNMPPPRFNLAGEWQTWPRAPLKDAGARSGIGVVTDSLPPFYQVTPMATNALDAVAVP